jgi:broad specificity phosphatase PhoE
MTLVTRWWWIRHAPVRSGGRIYGNDDPPADCADLDSFRYLARAMPEQPLWVVSHLQRTHQTAAAIRDHLPNGAAEAPIQLVEPTIAEQSFGHWQGLTIEELNQQRDGAWHRFWLAPAHQVPPGGESFIDVMARVSGTIDRLLADHGGRDIVVVAHGGTIRAAIAHALGLSPEKALGFVIENCSLTRLDHISGASGSHPGADRDSWRVSGINHLPNDLD